MITREQANWIAVSLLGGILLAAGWGCSQQMGGRYAEQAAQPAMAQNTAGVQAIAGETVAGDVAKAAEAGNPQFSLSTPAPVDRYLIKNAQVALETEDAAEVADKLSKAVVGRGGYIANLRETMDRLGRRTLQVEARVPAAQLEDALLQLEPLGKVLSKVISTQDVTEEYVDTDARMRNLKKTEERILDHLNRMGTLDDILKVEKELGRVRGEIEQIEGRLRFLDQRVSFSSIQVTLTEAPAAEPMTPAPTFSTAQVFSQAVRSLLETLQVVWTMLIWIGVWAPIWFCLALAGWLAARIVRRRMR